MSTAHLCNTVLSLRSADGQMGVWSGKREEMEKSYRRNADVTAVQEERCHWPGQAESLPSPSSPCAWSRGVNYHRILYLYSVYIYSSGWLGCCNVWKQCEHVAILSGKELFWSRESWCWLMLAKLNNITAMTLRAWSTEPALN